MPEGDTVFRTARTLQRALAGRQVTAFDTALSTLTSGPAETRLVGQVVESVSARAKHLLIAFSGDLVLRSHLRMHGSWHIYRPGERWRARRADARIVVATDEWLAVAFNVVDAELLTTSQLARHRRLSAIGVDLLGAAPDLVRIRNAMRAAAPVTSIADALIAQQFAAGLGNVYKSELLFLERIHPFVPVAQLSDVSIEALLVRGRDLLRLNVSEASTVGASGQRMTTGRLNPHERLWVYGRAGRPCFACRSPIQSWAATGGRRTYWCPTCQPAPAPA